MSLKITHLILQTYHPGTNELNVLCWFYLCDCTSVSTKVRSFACHSLAKWLTMVSPTQLCWRYHSLPLSQQILRFVPALIHYKLQNTFNELMMGTSFQEIPPEQLAQGKACIKILFLRPRGSLVSVYDSYWLGIGIDIMIHNHFHIYSDTQILKKKFENLRLFYLHTEYNITLTKLIVFLPWLNITPAWMCNRASFWHGCL